MHIYTMYKRSSEGRRRLGAGTLTDRLAKWTSQIGEMSLSLLPR